jgi:hypothetical protein
LSTAFCNFFYLTFVHFVHISENVRNSGRIGAEKGKTAARFRQKPTAEFDIIDLSERRNGKSRKPSAIAMALPPDRSDKRRLFHMQNLWKQVADQYCTSAEEVQAEIAEAIRQGMDNPDADVQQAWAEIPRQQDELQPEDVVAWIAAQLLATGILSESAAVLEKPEMAVKR